MPALHPKHCASPASYEPAMKRIVDHSCTLEDVANFVVDFINSDILGMIANKHLILSDLSSHGVEDPNCVLLSKLHSDAVDFPKSGTPVPISSLPKVKIEKKPDWDAGEMSTDSARYYTSQKALGILYREVKMADEEERGEDILKTRTRYVDRTIFEELLVSSTARERRLRNIVSNTLKPVLRQHIDIEYSHDETALARAQFLAFEAELRHISTHCTLSFRHKPLKEAEIFVGTIFAKTSQQ
jgi:RNA-dependent RNA polymerase